MVVCQTCGDTGWAGTLITCSNCQIIAEHSYCVDKSTTVDGEVRWVCEFCEPRIVELSDSTGSSSGEEPSQSSKPLQDILVPEQLRTPLKSEESQYGGTGDSCRSIAELRTLFTSWEKKHSKAKEMHNIVKDMHFNAKDCATDRVEASYSCSQGTSTVLEDDFLATVHPLPDIIWMGSFCINGEYSCTIDGMVAHMSNEACTEASEVTRLLPVLLSLEMVPKINIWPAKFLTMEPAAENIAVYFFPENDRAEREYERLVDDIFKEDFAMISRVDNTELLVFSSRELPIDIWRYRRKYYLWGLLRRKKKISPQTLSGDHLSNQNKALYMASETSYKGKGDKYRDP